MNLNLFLIFFGLLNFVLVVIGEPDWGWAICSFIVFAIGFFRIQLSEGLIKDGNSVNGEKHD